MRLAPAVFANLVFFFAAVGYGRVLRPLLPRRLSRIDRAALMLLGGIGLPGTLLFLVGQIRLSRSVIIIALFPAVWGAVFVARNVGSWRRDVLQMRPPLLPAAIVGVVLLAISVAGLAAPTGDISTMGLKSNAIAYHFLGPRVWLRNRIIRPVPDEYRTAMPALVETDYCALISLGGPRAPGLFGVMRLGVLLLIAAGLAVRLGLTERETWWTAALIAAMPVVTIAATSGYVDAIYSAFVLGALRLTLDLESRSTWVLFGIFGGFAMATKYTGIIAWLLLAICVFAASRAVLKVSCPKVIKQLALGTFVAACIAGPWYLRNWLLLGSPIYPPPPFLLPLFHARYLGADAIRALQTYVWRVGNGMGRSFSDFLLLPFHLTMHAANFLDGAGGIGLAPLALAPFAIIVYWRNAYAALVGGFVALQVVAWFISEQDGRFFVHVLVLAVIAAVAGWRYIVRISPRTGSALAAIAVALSVSYGLFMIGSNQTESIHAVLSKTFEAQRMQAEIPFLDSFERLNSDPSVERVLFLSPNVPAYYSQKNYLKPFGRWGEKTVPGADTVPQVLAQLRQLHISDILDVRWPGGKFDVPSNTPGLQLIFSSGNQRIYRVLNSRTSATANAAKSGADQ